LKRSEDYMVDNGSDLKFIVSAFNYSRDESDQKVVAVVSWSKHHEDLLADVSRGGC
jgi:hypothetical protein